MSVSQVFVGIDVATAPRALARHPTGDRGAVTHDAPGMTALGTRLPEVAPQLMGLAATGGDQRAVVAALAAAAFPLVVGNPRQGRDVAKATGPCAQTAGREARAVAQFAAAVRPTPRPLPDAQHRLENTSARRRADIMAPIAWLAPRVAPLADDLDPTRRASPVWRERETWDRRVPGMGPVCARTLGRALPALGTFSRQRLAALGGVAPFTRDSGTLRGPRATWYMRVLVAVRSHPVRNAFYQRLWRAGKAKKGARTACMRQLWTMLNAMIKPQKPWHVQEVPRA